MYRRVLVALENSPYDDCIVDHVRRLARTCGSSLVLIHVADGWAARNAEPLKLRESEEMRLDRQYLEEVCARVEEDGLYEPPSGMEGLYVATVRAIVQQAALSPAIGRRKVFVIGDAERVSRNCQHRVNSRATREEASVNHIEVFHVMCLAVAVDY